MWKKGLTEKAEWSEVAQKSQTRILPRPGDVGSGRHEESSQEMLRTNFTKDNFEKVIAIG